MTLPVDVRANATSSYDAPRENFAQGLLQVDLPAEFGPPTRGKVRDNWTVNTAQGPVRILVTTDRKSAYDRQICTIPGVGQVLNGLSAWWFENTADIVPNHMIAVPHPNVLIARQAVQMLPVEVVLRRYMARSSTSTSVYDHYANKGEREIYGLTFPDGLQANQEFPMGTIVTPTTKAEHGHHDVPLTNDEAQELVDKQLGAGMWERATNAALALFERARIHCLEKGLILVDTKLEFGIDSNRQSMLTDEVFTPDSSRYWLADDYAERFAAGQTPTTFDKELLRRWLADKGFKGEGPVPKVDAAIIEQMATAYAVPYEMITGMTLPPPVSDPQLVRQAVLDYVKTLSI